MKKENNNLRTDKFTGYFDDQNKPIHLGDHLKSECEYEIIVCRRENGDYYGRLVCDESDSCKDIPYVLNKGKGYTKIKI